MVIVTILSNAVICLQQVIQLFQEHSDNSCFCLSCAKPALTAIFVEKDMKQSKVHNYKGANSFLKQWKPD